MAACRVLDFGVTTPSRHRRKEEQYEVEPQQVQEENVNRYLQRSPDARTERYIAPLDAGEQRSEGTNLPLWASLVENRIKTLPTSDDVEVPPTTYAHVEARRVIGSAYVAIWTQRTHKPPTPIIGTDDLGGILVSWTSGNKYVAAKFASQPESRSFVYSEQGVEHQAVDLNEQSLSHRLRWLSE